MISANYFWEFLSRFHLAFAITIWGVSLIELFLSYFIIRITIFVYGILTGLIIGVVAIAQTYTDYISQNDGICIVIIVLSLLIGFFYGISLLTMPRLGYVNIGLWVAVVIGLLCQNAVLYLSGTLLGFYILTGILALIMTIIALLAMRFFIIISTCFLSAFGLIRPLGFLLPGFPNELNVAYNPATPWQFYLYLLSIIIITVLGSVFQFCILKKKGRGKSN